MLREAIPRRASWRRRIGKRALLSALGLLVGVVLAESGLRIHAWWTASDELHAWQSHTAHDVALTDGRSVRFGQLVRPSKHPEIVYELLPNLDVRFQGHRVRTGDLGFRGGDPSTASPDDAPYTIIGLGDSVLFGSGVATEETFLAVLGAQLQQHHRERTIVTINTGVPGYNTTMEVATLEHKGLALAPNLVLIDFVENDFDLPNFLLRPASLLRVDRLLLYDLAYRVLRHGRRPNGPLEAAPMANTNFFVSDPARVPAAYRHMVGKASYRRALQRLQQLGAERNFRILVTCHTEIAPAAQAICRELGLPVVTAAARQRAWLHDHQQTLMESELVVSPSDRHPSALGHRLLAGEIAAFLDQRDWL